MFDPVDPKQRLPDLEEGILKYWREEGTFKRSIHRRQRNEGDALDGHKTGEGHSFSFYDGPPFATGLPHYGHLLAGTIKDVIPRYQTMRGKAVERRFGWDCHGLPVENLIEKEHNITDHKQIEKMGVAVFNDLCRKAVLRYTQEWRTVVERMGRWVDMDWDYRTMDPDYMESIWWVFSELAEKKLIYEGYKPMHICPHCATPLSNFEVTQGYSDRTDMSVIMTFPLVEDPNTILLAWTTTPWSLPGNMWLAVGKDISYAKVSMDGKTYVLAEKLVEKVFKGKEHEVIGTVSAKELIGKKYTPLFPYFVDTVIPSTLNGKKTQTYGDRVFQVITNDAVEVSDAEGTGIVHITSSTGEDSFAVAKAEKVDVLVHIRIDGSFVEEVTDFVGLNAKPQGEDPMSTDKKVIENLKERGRHFSHFTITHSYPHCWRCDTPLLPYTTSSWFVAVEQMKEKMLEANEKTEWVPSHVRDGRFGRWLENARDWAISRNRYWGTPLPIWRTEHGDDMTVITGRDDLMKEHKVRFTKVTALRHAQSEGNVIPIYQGKDPGTDLTKTGKEQARAAAEFLGTQDVAVIYTSPLARTRQTAEILAKKTGARVVVDERLREVEFGEYEGKNVDFSDLAFLKARRAHKIDSGKPESIYHFEGMETWSSVQQRVSDFMKEVLPRHRSEHIVIVTHADPLMNIKQFFSNEDAVKLSHQPYPSYAEPQSFFWDHDREAQMDLHKETVDTVSWAGSKNDKSTEITLVRHGETIWNAQNKENGWSDDPLSDTGREQAKKTAATLKKMKFDAVICSDLPRARETAEIITSELGWKIDDQWAELRERNTGEWQGMDQDEIRRLNPPVEPEFLTTSFHQASPAGGETLSIFIARAESAIEKILKNYPGKRVLVVTHGGMIRAFHALVENRTFREAASMYPENAKAYPLTLNPRLKRIPEVLDCWFESGSMPYAEKHFPFEMRHQGMKKPPAFPADFIAEGMDQTRGWFYTLTVLGTALYGVSPFENCVVNGIVLAEDGKKMSKRLKNYPEPTEVVKVHGADAVRFTLMSSPAVRGEDLRFSEKLVQETVRNVLLPLWNTYSFFVTYATAATFEPSGTRTHSSHPLDLWMRAEMQDLVNRMTHELDRYDLSGTCNEIHETIDALTNWYVRLSRRRFAGKGAIDNVEDNAETGEEDRNDALNTLHDVLITLSQLLAPFCPFITDAIYLNLVPEAHGSVHLTDWPQVRELSDEERALIEKTRVMRLVVSLGNGVRSEQKMKNRQPLAKATIAIPPKLKKHVHFTEDDRQLLRQELNVKEIVFADNPEELAESYVQVDARAVGPRLGSRVQEIIKAGKAGEFHVRDDGMIVILEEELGPEEAQLVYRGKEGQTVAADRGVVVSLDTHVNEELEREGFARDLIRAVQRLRKEAGFNFTDQISLSIEGADDVLASFTEVIAQETRSTFARNTGEPHEIDVEGKAVTIRFTKA